MSLTHTNTLHFGGMASFPSAAADEDEGRPLCVIDGANIGRWMIGGKKEQYPRVRVGQLVAAVKLCKARGMKPRVLLAQ